MIDTQKFETLLQEEKEKLERELGGLGKKTGNPNDWEPTPVEMDTSQNDPNEVADAIEEFEARSAIEVELEKRYQNVVGALNSIKEGTYGVCRVGGEEIEVERLVANPAATTCLKHINS